MGLAAVCPKPQRLAFNILPHSIISSISCFTPRAFRIFVSLFRSSVGTILHVEQLPQDSSIKNSVKLSTISVRISLCFANDDERSAGSQILISQHTVKFIRPDDGSRGSPYLHGLHIFLGMRLSYRGYHPLKIPTLPRIRRETCSHRKYSVTWYLLIP